MPSQSKEQLEMDNPIYSKHKQSKNKLALFVFLTVSLMVSTITLGVLYGQEKGDNSGSSSASIGGMCQSSECIAASHRILSAMNQEVKPCDNFFEFSCGKWVKDHLISESKSSTSVFDDVRELVTKSLKTVLETPSTSGEHSSIKKSKDFYASCMDTATIDSLDVGPIKDLIVGMNGLPLIGDTLHTWPLEEQLATFASVYGTGAILSNYVYTDSKSSDDYIFQITEPSLGMPSRDYYLDEKTSAKAIPGYKAYIVNLMKLLAVGTSTTDASIEAFADEVVEFETKVANKTMTSSESRDEAAIYNKWTLDEVKSKVNTGFDWTAYTSKCLEVAEEPGRIKIDGNTEVVMYAERYGSDFTTLVAEYSEEFIQSYLVWRVLKNRHSYMPSQLREARAPYSKAVSGTTAEDPRWQSCAGSAEGFFPMPVGSLFVESFFSEESKTATEVMVAQIQVAFKENLLDIDWMDEETKKQAEIKADKIVDMIAYPDYIVNDKGIMDDKYSPVTIDKAEYFTNAHKLSVFGSKFSYGKFGGKVDRDEWISGPAIVNAFYSPTRNQIFFPAGILQPPFYDQYQPTAMNYGGIGMVIGHEITHGFDNSGANYDGDGNLKNWWSESSKNAFDKEADCLIEQYSNETWEVAGDHLDGALTLGENIADNGGLRESFLAFRKWQQTAGSTVNLPGLQDFTDEQLFFLGFSQVWCGKYTEERAVQLLKTDPHSPGEFRVKIPGLNYEEFGKAYNCKKGVDYMYPNESDTCRVW